MLDVRTIVEKLGPYRAGFARIVVEHKNKVTELHRITGALFEVNIQFGALWPDETDASRSYWAMDVEAAPFTANQQAIENEIAAISGVIRVDTLYLGS